MALAAFMSSEAFMPAIAAGVGVVAAVVFIATSPTVPREKAEADDDSAGDEAETVVASSTAGRAGELRRRRGAGSEACKEAKGSQANNEGGGQRDAKASAGGGAKGGKAAAAESDAAGAKSESAGDAGSAAGEAAAAEGAAAGEKEPESILEAWLDPKPKPKKRLTDAQEAQIRKNVCRLPPEHQKALHEWVNMKDQSKWALVAMNCMVLILVVSVIIGICAYLIGVHEINPLDIETYRNASQHVEAILRQYRVMRPNRANQELAFSHSPEL